MLGQFTSKDYFPSKQQTALLSTGSLPNSVTRLGDLLVFWASIKACGDDMLAQIADIFVQFSSGSIFGQLLIDIGQLLTQAFWSPCFQSIWSNSSTYLGMLPLIVTDWGIVTRSENAKICILASASTMFLSQIQRYLELSMRILRYLVYESNTNVLTLVTPCDKTRWGDYKFKWVNKAWDMLIEAI